MYSSNSFETGCVILATTCFYGGFEYQPKAVWVDANTTTQLACVASGSSVVIQASGVQILSDTYCADLFLYGFTIQGCVAPDSSVIPVNGFKQIGDSGFLTCVPNSSQKLRASLVGIQGTLVSKPHKILNVQCVY